MGGSRRRTIPLLVLTAAVAMATIVTAYASWAETVAVSGSVTTGNLNAEWVDVSCWPVATPGGPGLASADLSIDGSDPSFAWFTLTNGYPGYKVACSLDYENHGTVPWKVTGHTILEGANLTGCTLSGADVQTLSCAQMDIVWKDGTGSVVRPGVGEGESSKLLVLIKDGAGEAATYGFTVVHSVAQCTTAECLAEP